MIINGSSVESLNFAGLNVFDYTPEMETRSSFAVVEVPPGASHREAYSETSEKYYYVVAGQVAFYLDGGEHKLASGDLCLVAQGQHFSYVNRTQDVATLVLVHTPSFDLGSEVFLG